VVFQYFSRQKYLVEKAYIDIDIALRLREFPLMASKVAQRARGEGTTTGNARCAAA